MLVETRAARQVAVVFYGLVLAGGAGPAAASALLVPLPGALAAGLGLLAGAAGTLDLTQRFATAGRELRGLLGSVAAVWTATAALLLATGGPVAPG
ncbi:hypothetical protein [Streptomyces sp. NPDC089799]|uniref:hypothetical protein n=1 Tax=Streptomyces sp. NPDC089799 TaxID=3155066 RepID=UPI00342479BF